MNLRAVLLFLVVVLAVLFIVLALALHIPAEIVGIIALGLVAMTAGAMLLNPAT